MFFETMLIKLKNFLNNLKQSHFYLYTFLYVVFLHALVGSITVIVNYQKYTLIPFIVVLIALCTPFVLLWIAIYFELILYNNHPKLVKILIYIFNSVLVITQLLTTNLTLLYIFNEIGK